MYVLLAARKARAIRTRNVDRQATALNNKAWPEDVVKVSNNITNQFELPVLFYVVCLVLYVINGVTAVTVAAAWVFVLSRCVHAWIHTGGNYVPYRFRSFLISIAAFLVMLVAAILELAN